MTSRLRLLMVTLAATVLLVPALQAQEKDDTASHTEQAAKPKKNRDRNLLTRADIEQAQLATAYDVVRRMRPAWFRIRGGTGIMTGQSTPIMVYFNGQRYGTLEVLRDMPSSDVEQMRFLNGTDATLRFGAGNDNGAIMVQSRVPQPQ